MTIAQYVHQLRDLPLWAIRRACEPEACSHLDGYNPAKPPERAWCNPATWLNQERWLDEPAKLDLHAAARPSPEHGFAGVARTLMEQDNGTFQ